MTFCDIIYSWSKYWDYETIEIRMLEDREHARMWNSLWNVFQYLFNELSIYNGINYMDMLINDHTSGLDD